MEKKMEEMIYQKELIRKVLFEEDTKDGYKIIILSLGTHPTAYIGLPNGNMLENVDYSKLNDDECYIDCHGGLTYSDYGVIKKHKDVWFIGWDYGHLGDYSGYNLENYGYNKKNKKWTTEEIYKECLIALDDIKKIKLKKKEISIFYKD